MQLSHAHILRPDQIPLADASSSERSISLQADLPEPFRASRAFRPRQVLSAEEIGQLEAAHIMHCIANPDQGSRFETTSRYLQANIPPKEWIGVLLESGYEALLYGLDLPDPDRRRVLAHIFSQREGACINMFNVEVRQDFRQRGIAEAVLRRFVADCFLDPEIQAVRLGADGDRVVQRIHAKISVDPCGLPVKGEANGLLQRVAEASSERALPASLTIRNIPKPFALALEGEFLALPEGEAASLAGGANAQLFRLPQSPYRAAIIDMAGHYPGYGQIATNRGRNVVIQILQGSFTLTLGGKQYYLPEGALKLVADGESFSIAGIGKKFVLADGGETVVSSIT